MGGGGVKYLHHRHTFYVVIVLLWFPSSTSASALQFVKPQPNCLVCTLRTRNPSKQSVAVQSHGLHELLGNEIFEDYLDETTNLNSSSSASNATKLKTASNEDLV